MSLENLKLNPYNLGLLYNNGLVEQKSSKQNDVKISVLGNNTQRVTILVNESDAPIISDNNLAFLTKLLAACKLNIDQVAILNLASSFLQINNIASSLQPRVVLMFGVTATQIALPIVFPDNKVQQHDGINFIRTKDLATLQTDAATKSALWAALKAVFVV